MSDDVDTGAAPSGALSSPITTSPVAIAIALPTTSRKKNSQDHVRHVGIGTSASASSPTMPSDATVCAARWRDDVGDPVQNPTSSKDP